MAEEIVRQLESEQVRATALELYSIDDANFPVFMQSLVTWDFTTVNSLFGVTSIVNPTYSELNDTSQPIITVNKETVKSVDILCLEGEELPTLEQIYGRVLPSFLDLWTSAIRGVGSGRYQLDGFSRAQAMQSLVAGGSHYLMQQYATVEYLRENGNSMDTRLVNAHIVGLCSGLLQLAGNFESELEVELVKTTTANLPTSQGEIADLLKTYGGLVGAVDISTNILSSLPQSEDTGFLLHDVRTPLTSTSGFTTTLLAEDVTFGADDVMEFWCIMKQERRTAAYYMEDFALYEYVHSSRCRSIHIDSRGLIAALNKEYTYSMTTMLGTSGVEAMQSKLQEDIDESLDGVILSTDISAVIFVIRQYLGNALKYGRSKDQDPEKPIAELKSYITEWNGNRYMAIEVADNGSGINESLFPDISVVFNKDVTTAGTGKGLDGALEIAGKVEALVGLANRPEGGASFYVLVPISN
jgi:signal transduction histidine kinase